MKKFMALIVAAVCMLSLAGCGNQGKTDAIDSIKKDEVDACEYAFSGGNEVFSISNGHIYIDRISRFDGGTLEIVDKELFDKIASYSEKYYVISNDEEYVFLSNTVKDETGTAVNVAKIGEISSEDLFENVESEDLVDNLWYEIKTVDLEGEENTYKVQLDVTVIEK